MTSNQLQYQKNLISSSELDETKRHNIVSESNDYKKAIATLMQAGASEKQAEAALQNAAANASKAETERWNFWSSLAQNAARAFGLTPMSASEIGANIGSAARGAGSVLGALL